MLIQHTKRLAVALSAASLIAASQGFGDALLIESQNFNSLPGNSTFTTDSLSNGSLLTNTGSSNSGGPGLDFASYWFDSRVAGSGPVTPTSDSSDFIGVNSFSGSNSPNVSPSGVAVSEGSEHNFEFNDTDGRIDLIFEPVDLSDYIDRSVQISYWINEDGFEADDAFYISVSDGFSSQTYLNFGEAELEGNASADDGTSNWKTAFIDLEELFELGFGEMITLTISVDNNSASENIFIDDVLFQSGAEPPDGEDDPAIPVAIFEIQGAGHMSPYEGSEVSTAGIVTAVDSNGYYLQDGSGDGDLATSDAIFVFTGSNPGVVVGDAVEVIGVVAEFVPGGSSTGNLSTTEIVSPESTIISSGNALPTPVMIGAGGRLPPTESIDDDAFASFDPESDGIDFFESLEGMLVTAQELVAISGTNRFGEIFAVVNGGAGASGLSASGTLNISPEDFNPERVQIDPDSGVLAGFDAPLVNVGALLGDVTGVVSYNFGNFEIIPTQAFTPSESPLVSDATDFKGKKNKLTVATYNVLNLDPNDSDGDTDLANDRFEAVAGQIVFNLNAPDVIALQEAQDDSGSANDGVTSAELTLQALVEAIEDLGGPSYAFIDNTFIGNNTSGGQPGANIRVAFLYNPDRVELDPASVRSIDAADQQSNPENPFFGSRLSLVAEFSFNGQAVLVVNNHFSSKGGSAPIFGIEQPFDALQEDPMVNGSLDERRAQAAAVKAFVDAALAEDEDARVIALGDFNEFEFISPLQDILGSSLTNLIETLPENERYSYVFEGNSQSLDHILVSDKLLKRADIQIVHVNAEFAETDARASDHDPVIAEFTIKKSDSKKEKRRKIVKKLKNRLDELFGERGPLRRALDRLWEFLFV